MVCDSSLDGKVASQELPPLEEEEEPSPVRENHHISHQSLSKHAQGLAMLPRTSYSDNDLSIQVTLRNPQGLPRRSSLEHRRSLTSLTSGLCAIPEIEDSPSGTDQPIKSSGAMLRSWSHEQAPPPNPSPPCKGRARAALGMGMTSMKSVGGVYHPGSHRQHVSQSSTLTSNSLSSGMASSSLQSSLSASYSPVVLNPPPEHDQPVSASAPSSSSSSSSSSSVQASLDTTVSSQSPGYLRRAKALQGRAVQNVALSNGDLESEHCTERWRFPSARKKRFQSKIQQNEDNYTDEVFDISKHHEIFLAKEEEKEEEMHSRRLSLDSGVGMYAEGSNVTSEVVDFDRNSKTRRRLSVGTQKKGREHGVEMSHKNVRSPEEEERLSRWRALQEEELASRTKKIGLDMTDHHCTSATETTEYKPQHKKLHYNQKLSPHLACASQKMDAVEQRVAHEEARFARWRHLEETGRPGFHSEKDTSCVPSTDKGYVSDVLSGRLQPPASANPAVTASTTPLSCLQGMLPLPVSVISITTLALCGVVFICKLQEKI